MFFSSEKFYFPSYARNMSWVTIWYKHYGVEYQESNSSMTTLMFRIWIVKKINATLWNEESGSDVQNYMDKDIFLKVHPQQKVFEVKHFQVWVG